MLAYSSVAQIGYMVLGISFASITGLTGGIVHMFNHAMIKCGLFMALGCVILRVGSADLENMKGIAKRMPATMFAWVICGLGIIGVPVTAGFTSKWYLVSAALERGWWPVAMMVLISSLLALVYIWKVVEVAYFEEPSERCQNVKEAPLSMLLPMYVLALGTVVFGIWTPYSVGIAQQAATLLLGAAP